MRLRRSALLLVLLMGAGFISVAPASAATLSGACNSSATGDFNGDLYDDLAVGVPNEDVGTKNSAGAVDVLYGSDLGITDDEEDPLFLHQDTNGIEGVVEAGDQFGACVASGDFNGDGYSDLAVGAPGEDFSSKRGSFDNTGVVHVIFGSAAGLKADGNQLFSQDTRRIGGVNEKDDEWGSAFAVGDFDGDEIDDLAIGAPREDIRTLGDAGAAWVLFGTTTGLTGNASVILYQDVPRVAGRSEAGDLFGASMAAGDLDGNGRDDLVLGVPGESIKNVITAGAIQLFLSNNDGPNVDRERLWHQDASGVIGVAEDDDRFGAAVAVGDFDSDGLADVAIGVPSEDLGGTDEGVIQILYSTETGPTAAGDEMFSADDFVTNGTGSEDDAFFGAALSAGNTEDPETEAKADLFIGAPFQDGLATVDSGAVYVMYGDDPDGLDPDGDMFIEDDAGGAEGDDDHFGASLTNGNLDGADGRDLVAGAPNDNDIEDGAGLVGLIFSDGAGLDPASNQQVTQDDGDDPDGREEDDNFGLSVG